MLIGTQEVPRVTMEEDWAKLVAAAADGDQQAARRLVDALLPVVHRRVTRTLTRAKGADHTRKGEVEDLSQEAYGFLFRDRAKALRDWDPGRGMSFLNYVGLRVTHRVLSLLKGHQVPIEGVDPLTDERLTEAAQDDVGPETMVLEHELLEQLLDRMRLTVSEQGMELFQLMFVEGLSIPDVAQRYGMKPGAVYTWRARLRKIVAKLASEMVDGRADSSPRSGVGGE